MTTQPTLFDSAPPPSPPPSAESALVKILRGRGWRTARQLTADMGFANTESGRRLLREAAADSKGQVAGGQRGYKLVAEMDEEEYWHAVNWMQSQAREMQARVAEMHGVRNGKAHQ